MRIYEELFIIRPDAPEEEVDPFLEQMKGVVTNAGGTVDKVDKWGKRRLAYRVDKYKEGAYVLFQFSSGPETVKEFERRLRVSDLVIKFLTVRIDETLKRLDKRKKEREKRAHRKATAAPAPAQPSVAQESLPLLRREDRRHQLQGHEAAAQLHRRARQDRAPAHFGRVRAAPAAADGCHQKGAEHRAAAVRVQFLENRGADHHFLWSAQE